MVRKLTIILVSVLICLIGAMPVLAQRSYNLKEYEKITGKKIEKYSEAPVLKVKVAAGELPPVEERLPKEPVVVEPLEEIGQYGGTWKMALTAQYYIFNTFLNARIDDWDILRYDITGTKLLPNKVDKWTISEDLKTYTLHWREGLKWCDGQPFTTDDIMFWYKDMLLNKELTPVFPYWLKMGDKQVEIEKVDTYTIRFHLPQPNGVYLHTLFASFKPHPKHYLKQFHPKYTPLEKLQEQAKKEGFDYWHQLFTQKASYDNPECPSMGMWKLVSVSSVRVVAERNPYYWKVDIAGNQLPYIDRVVFDIIPSGEVIVMKAISGELDLQTFHLPLSSYPVIKEGEEKGNYRVLLWSAHTGEGVLYPNHTYEEDPFMAELLQNPTFKKALSLAINRDEANELTAYDLAVPGQLSPPLSESVADEEFTKAYADYNPGRANELLDSIKGISKRDKEGFRLRADGQPLELNLLITADWPWHVDIAPLVKKYWEDIGIKTVIDSLSFSLRTERLLANSFQVFMWKIDTPFLVPLYLKPESPLSMFGWIGCIAPLWSQWEGSGGEKGEEPPKEYFELKKLIEEAVATLDKAEQTILVKKMWENFGENLWAIGTLLEPPTLVVKKNNFRNVPDKVLACWTLRGIANAEVAQFFIEQ